MKHKILLAAALVFSPALWAVDGYYVGGAFGHVGAPFGNSLGFGGELAFRTNAILDVSLRSQASQHPGSVSLWATTMSADFLINNWNDIEIFLGGGPGFYQFNTAGTLTSRFGLHGEAYADLVVNDMLKLGLAFRYHGIFSPGPGEGSYYTVMMRVGLFFSSSR